MTLLQDAAALLSSGFSTVTEEMQQRRLEVCSTCPSFDAQSTRCKECGCYMHIKTKFSAMHCPTNKW